MKRKFSNIEVNVVLNDSLYDNNLLSIFFVYSAGGIPARNHKGERILLYCGLIDILQSYRFKKKLEHAMKAMVYDGVSSEMIDFQIFFNFHLNNTI